MKKYCKTAVLIFCLVVIFSFSFFYNIPQVKAEACRCCNSTTSSEVATEALCTAGCRSGQDYVYTYGSYGPYMCEFPCECCWRGGDVLGGGYSRGHLSKSRCQEVCSTSGGVKRWGDYTITAECPTPEEGTCNCCFAGSPQEGEYLSLTECRTACLDYGGAKQLLTPEGRWTNPAGCPGPEEEAAPPETGEEAPPTGGPLTGGLSSAAARAGFGGTKIENILQMIISVILGFVGVIFLIMILYGGLIWMTARGSAEDVEKAKKLIEAAIIGIVIVFAAYGVSYFLISKFAPGPPVAPVTPEVEELAPEEMPTECVPLAECPSGRCGTMDDGCGGVIDCPSCPSGQVCNTAVGRCESAPTEETAMCGCCDGRSRGNQTLSQCTAYCRDHGGTSFWGTTRIPCR